MTARIRDFLRNRTDDGPCLVVDLDVVRDNYQAFAKALGSKACGQKPMGAIGSTLSEAASYCSGPMAQC